MPVKPPVARSPAASTPVAGAANPTTQGCGLRGIGACGSGAMALGQVQLTLDGEPLVPMAVKPTVAVAPGASVPS
jgi:hypothetical protein